MLAICSTSKNCLSFKYHSLKSIMSNLGQIVLNVLTSGAPYLSWLCMENANCLLVSKDPSIDFLRAIISSIVIDSFWKVDCIYAAIASILASILSSKRANHCVALAPHSQVLFSSLDYNFLLGMG